MVGGGGERLKRPIHSQLTQEVAEYGGLSARNIKSSSYIIIFLKQDEITYILKVLLVC